MDATATAVQTDDIEIVVPVGGDDEEYEPIPPGAYPGRLTQFRVVDKPEWKQEQDLKRNPDKPVDKLQWEWTFELAGEYAGVVIVDYTSRSWHERANAHKHAAALLGKPYLQPVEGMSTKQLIGNACQVWVTESTSKTTGKTRNYVDKILPVPTRKGKTAPAQPPQDLEFDEAPGFNDGVPDMATEKQVKAVYAVGRANKRFSEAQTDDKAIELFGIRPQEMTRGEASQFIDVLKGEAAI